MIDQPGVYDISAADYHRDPCPQPSLSASVARVLLDQSPAHAWQRHPKLNPNYAPEENDRFDIGTMAHSLLLEQDDSKLVVIDAADWRTSVAKAARDEARAAGKLPILAKHVADLRAMVKVATDKIRDSELIGMFGEGKPEQSLIWQDEGVWCRSRVDYLSNDYGTIFEYKTTTDASPSFFTRQIGNMGYDMQAEFYRRGLAALGLHDNPVQIICAQEIEPPYACALYTLSNAYIEIAQHKVERAIQTWRMCLQSGLWPAYPNRIEVVEPPAWELHAYQHRLAMESGDWQ